MAKATCAEMLSSGEPPSTIPWSPLTCANYTGAEEGQPHGEGKVLILLGQVLILTHRPHNSVPPGLLGCAPPK